MGCPTILVLTMKSCLFAIEGFKMCLKASQSVIPMSKLTFACYETHISYSMMRICKGSALQVGCNDLPILLYTPHLIFSVNFPPHFSNCLLSKTLLVSNAPLDDHLIQSAKQTFDPKYLISPIIFLIECCGLCVSNLVV